MIMQLSLTGFTQLLSASQETVASSQDALLSKKERSDSPNLSTSEPDVRSIRRYSRESLLSLRNSELSKRKPEQLHFGRAWVRIGVSSEGKLKCLFFVSFPFDAIYFAICWNELQIERVAEEMIMNVLRIIHQILPQQMLLHHLTCYHHSWPNVAFQVLIPFDKKYSTNFIFFALILMSTHLKQVNHHLYFTDYLFLCYFNSLIKYDYFAYYVSSVISSIQI